MALSNFVKQLLETDSVFGTRAKKLTGINDRTAQIKYLSDDNFFDEGLQLDISVNPSNSYIAVSVHQYGSALGVPFPVPGFMRPGKFFRLGIANIAIARSTRFPDQRDVAVDRKAAEEIDGAILLIEDIFIRGASSQSIPVLEIQCSRAVGSGPLLEDLSLGKFDDDALDEFGPVDLEFDVRIASLIDDQQIAAFSSRGSTRFNLDNIGVADTQDKGGGIASRYAAHYHGDKLINLVTNTRDDTNNPLYRLQLNETQLSDSTFDAVYNPDVALQYLYGLNLGTSEDIRIEYSDSDSIDTVATYGYVGTRGTGQVAFSGLPIPTISAVDHGTRVSVGQITFEYGLPASSQTPFLKPWFEPNPFPLNTQLFERLRTLRDAMRIHLGSSQWVFDITSGTTDTFQTLRLDGARDNANNTIVSHVKAPRAPFDVVSTISVTGCSSPRVISGNQFKTFDDLVNVLSADTEYNITVEKQGSLNTMTFSTTIPPRKIIRFITPSNAANIFETPAGGILVRDEIGDQALNQIIIPAELVLDRQGNVVFSRELSGQLI